jgi:hypothetical protein
VFLAAALATAAILFAIVASDGSNPLAAPRRDDRLFGLGLLAFGFTSLIALPGVVLTFFYLRRPYGWIRGAYRVLLFLIVVAWMLNFITAARVFITRSVCWDCGLEAWSIQTVVPASLFIALCPARPGHCSHATRRGGGHSSGLVTVRFFCAMDWSNRCSAGQSTALDFQESRYGSRECLG